MPIRDRFRRAMRRTESTSSDDISQSESNTTTSTANTSQSSLSSPIGSAPHIQIFKPTRDTSSKKFPWMNNVPDEKQLKKQQKKDEKEQAKRGKLHPSERPLTEQNQRHQEILNQFTMTFGATKSDESRPSFQGGVSPCCTRPPSIVVEHIEGQ